ncbi:MAG: ABC transporter ATP-binding protein [Ferrimicrobium sp.]
MPITSYPTVTFSGVSYSYPHTSVPVIDGIDLTVEPGEVLALVGPSGSGKSTLLSILGLLMKPTKGIVEVDGHDAWRTSSAGHELARSLFAWVLQNSACLESRTAIDNVAIALMSEGLSRKESDLLASEALSRVGLGERLHARATELSGGQLQRMTVARALVGTRAIILADEPTGNLDRHNSDMVAEALLAAKLSGQSVVVATHDPLVAARCDQQLVLADGRLVV